MKSLIYLVNRKQCASFRIAFRMLAIASLWLMLATTNTRAHAQALDDVSNFAAAASSPGDWTQFHRDNMQRWNPYETVLGVGNVGNLQVKWRKFFQNGFLLSPTTMASGVVYFGANNHVYALDARTGAELWTYAAGDQVDSSPAVANGVVYFSSGDGNVYALNATTGAPLWRYTTGFVVTSSPAVANGVVYISSWDHNLYALNASTGAKLWSYTTGSFLSSSPAVANGVVYVGSSDGHFYALDASTGAYRWSWAINTTDSSPAVANGVVYVGSYDHNVYALNASTGAKLWSFTTGNQVDSSPAVANGVVYIGSQDRNMYALNAGTGAKLWSYAAGAAVNSSPAVANGVVYFTSGDKTGSITSGIITALNASTGAKLWSYFLGTGGAVFGFTPTIVDGVLYLCGAIDALQPPYVLRESGYTYAFAPGLSADLFLRAKPSTTTVHQGDLLTYAFPVWNLGPNNAFLEVLNTQVPAGTVFEYIRISGTPGLGTCTTPQYQGTGQIVCHENDVMAPNTTWTVRLTVKVTAAAGTTINANAATMADTPDPNLANNTATTSLTVQ